MLRQRYGNMLSSSKDCELVAQDIARTTHRTFGSNTLRRLLGFYGDDRRTYRYTLDTLAIYLGYTDWTELCKATDEEASDFTELDAVYATDLKAGDRVRIAYQPGRMLLLGYQGEGTFRVLERLNCKLLTNDVMQISTIEKGEKLICRQVMRDGKLLAATYRAGLAGGLTEVEVLPGDEV